MIRRQELRRRLLQRERCDDVVYGIADTPIIIIPNTSYSHALGKLLVYFHVRSRGRIERSNTGIGGGSRA